MNVFSAIPGPIRKAARALLPASFVDGVKDTIMRRYYVKGYVSRTGPVAFWLRRYVQRRPPVLHRLLFHVTDHCNLNCKGCTHFSNISPQRFIDPEDYRRQMARLTHVFSAITEIFLLGGEPLLHPRLESFIEITRAAYPHSRINVMTNGVLVPRMRDSFWDAMKAADAWLLCDDYPAGPSKAEIDTLALERGVNIEWTDPREEFYKLPIDLTGSQDAATSYRQCRGVMNCPVLRDGRLYPCAYTAFIDIFQKRFDVKDIEAGPADSISIEEKPYDIMRFLTRPVPWCRHCDFEHREFYEWTRSDRTIVEWLAAQRPRANH